MAAIEESDGAGRTRMELYQLKTFLAIARTGNLTRAAALLATSQPAVSAQLRALEEELGVALFSRTSRGMELTESGRALRAKAEEVDLHASELKAMAGAIAGKATETCRIGLNTEAGVLRVPELVETLARSAPNLAVELVQGVTRTILEDVTSGELAAGFVFGPYGRGELRALTLDRVELVIAAPATWKPRLEGAGLLQILAGPWVWPPRDCPFHEKALDLARAAGRGTPGGVTADDESTILRLVSSGIGLSLLPAFLVEEAEAKGQVLAVHGSGAEIELSFIWRAADSASPRVRPVVEGLAAIWAPGRAP
jgi:DNA-binding transcriptional LysR family regulator